MEVGSARDRRARRLVVKHGGGRDATRLTDAFGDRVDGRPAIPDLVDHEDPLAAEQRVGWELEERRVRSGLPRVVVELDRGDEDVPDPEPVGEHARRDEAAPRYRQQDVEMAPL